LDIGLGNGTTTPASADLASLGNCDSLDIGLGNGTTTPASADVGSIREDFDGDNIERTKMVGTWYISSRLVYFGQVLWLYIIHHHV
jgi:hypothetical protein